MTLLVDFLPGIFAKASLKARERLVAEFNKYFGQDKHLEGSLFVKLRLEHNLRFGLGLDDTAHTEVGQVNASVSNTVPGAFWAVWQTFADPAVYEDCLREALQLVQTDSAAGVCTMDLAQVRTACPVLVSTWQEVLRFHGTSISARVIQEDTVIDDQYLLKKGGMVIMPTRVVHTDEAIWGPTANQFDHKRFLKASTKGGGTGKRAPAAAFRGFGGGAVLCPGRHFVSTEILALTALLLVRFHVRPTSGRWVEPSKDFLMNTAFPTPLDKVDVELTPKDNNKWHVVFSDNNKGINITNEDLHGNGHH